MRVNVLYGKFTLFRAIFVTLRQIKQYKLTNKNKTL